MTAMFDFIRDIFRKEDISPTTIRIDEVPGILDNSEKELESDIRARTSDHMKKIEDARRDLIDLVMSLPSAEREEAFHPKLEKIAKNTLPLFVKSMHTALDRDLPSEPGEFYQAATECLKGCVKSQAGPGRYLVGVFPEEMKEIRAKIDLFGREMNSLTPVISQARSKRELIRRCRELHTGLRDRMREMESSRVRIPRLERELFEHRETLGKASDDLSGMMKGEEAERLQDLRAQEEAARQRAAAIERQMRGVFSNIAHVFRKGEKIMQRGESGRAPRELHQAVELMAAKEIPSWKDLEENMEPILGTVQSMIDSGEILLKNKEEKTLFSDPTAIRVTLSGLYRQRKESEEELAELQERYRESPARARICALENEIELERKKLMEFEDQLQVLKEAAEKAESLIPQLSGDLERRLCELLGREIVIEPAP